MELAGLEPATSWVRCDCSSCGRAFSNPSFCRAFTATRRTAGEALLALIAGDCLLFRHLRAEVPELSTSNSVAARKLAHVVDPR